MSNTKIIANKEEIFTLTNIIKEKAGITGPINYEELINRTENIGGGLTLPDLSNPASDNEIFLNKEVIGGNGNKITGTFTLDTELNIQDALVENLRTAINNLPEKTSGSGNLSVANVTISMNAPFAPYNIHYISADGFVSETDIVKYNIIITCLVPSIISLHGDIDGDPTVSKNITILEKHHSYLVNGDGSIHYN